jgi:hypothetical protein
VNGPAQWTALVVRAVVVLLVAGLVLRLVEPLFVEAFPGLLLILLLVGVYQIVLGGWGRGRRF